MAQGDFIVFTSPSNNRREHELNVARARSHAGYVTWSARKKAKKKRADALQRSKQCAPAAPGPTSLLNHGSSDPFDSFAAIRVTPQMNQLISYSMDRCQTMINKAPNTNQVGSKTFLQEEYQDFLRSLQDDRSAPALLFNFVSTMSNEFPGNNQLQLQRLEMKQSAFESLETLLGGSHEKVGPLLLKSLVPIFGGAVLAGDFREADIHGTEISHILDDMRKQSEPYSFATALDVLRAYYIDIRLGITRLRKPILPTNSGLEILEPFLKPLNRVVDVNKPAPESELDTSLSVEPLKSSYTRIRQAITLSMAPPATMIPSVVVALSMWPMITTGNVAGLLLIVFETASSSLEQQPSFEEYYYWHIQAILALSLLAYMCNFGRGNPTLVCSSDSSMADGVLTTMRTMLSQQPPDTSTDAPCVDLDNYQRARLWALFAGASCELQQQRFLMDNKSRPWLVTEFASQARSMQLLEWKDIKPILDKFEPVDVFEPPGSSWVDSAIWDIGV